MLKKIIIAVIAGLMLLASILYWQRVNLKDWYREMQKEPTPEAVSYEEIVEETEVAEEGLIAPDVESEPEAEQEIEIAESMNLDIPFQSQAPHGNWAMPWQEGCEEASIILSVKYLEGETSLTKDKMNNEILDMVSWQNANWGGHHDLTAKETAQMLEEYYDGEYETEIIHDFEWDDVKKALNQGYPVIAPAAGRQLGNPNFTPPGPLYHMLVIKGYTPSIVITNDVGTRNGADYQYTYEKLKSAMGNWANGAVDTSDKVIIIVKSL